MNETATDYGYGGGGEISFCGDCRQPDTAALLLIYAACRRAAAPPSAGENLAGAGALAPCGGGLLPFCVGLVCHVTTWPKIEDYVF